MFHSNANRNSNEIAKFILDVEKKNEAQLKLIRYLQDQKQTLMREFLDFGKRGTVTPSQQNGKFSYFFHKIETVSANDDECDLNSLVLEDNDEILSIGGNFYNLETICGKDFSDNAPKSWEKRRNDINVYNLTDKEMEVDAKKQGLAVDNIFFSQISNAQKNTYENSGTVTNLHLKNFFTVSIPMTQFQQYISPLLFIEHILGPERAIVFHGGWNCKNSTCNLRILTDVVVRDLPEILDTMTNSLTIDLSEVKTAIYEVMSSLRMLQTDGNGFIHGKLTTQSVLKKVGSSSYTILDLEDSSFYMNGFRFYKPFKATVGMDDNFFRDWTFEINEKYGMHYYKLYDFSVEEMEGLPGYLARQIKKYTVDSFNSIVDDFTGGILNYMEMDSNGVYYNKINEIIISNNPVASVSGSYDVYSFLCSLFSEDFMYINVMQYIIKNDEGKVVFDTKRCFKNLHNEKECRDRVFMFQLWRTLWFTEDLW